MSAARVFGVVLAGGLARRMGGGDKTLLPVGRRPILAHAIERLSPQVEDVAINANGDPSRFSGYAETVLRDGGEDRLGPLEGVVAGLTWARIEDASHIVTVAGDTPFFPRDLTARLFEAAREAEAPLACAMTGDRTHPVFGLWPVALLDDLRAALYEEGVRKVDRWTARHGCAHAAFAVGAFDPFFNVNTQEDLAEADRIAATPEGAA